MGDEPANAPKRAEAAAYEPGHNAWRRIAQPPMAALVSPPAVFLNGELLLLLGGTVDGGEVNGHSRPYETGGVYNLSRNKWRSHADPPQRKNETWPQVAMGDEVVMDGLAYNPRADSWRPLPDFPLAPREFPSVVWTGEELIVWGGAERPERNVIVDPTPLLATAQPTGRRPTETSHPRRQAWPSADRASAPSEGLPPSREQLITDASVKVTAARVYASANGVLKGVVYSDASGRLPSLRGFKMPVRFMLRLGNTRG